MTIDSVTFKIIVLFVTVVCSLVNIVGNAFACGRVQFTQYFFYNETNTSYIYSIIDEVAPGHKLP